MMSTSFTTETPGHRGNPHFRVFCVFALLCALFISGVNPVFARDAAPLADDPLTERRMKAISSELRCLVCQNETIADSHADLANDFRREIRKLIGEGKSDNEILEFMVARYGDFVRYRPPVKGTTILLWAGPGIMLAIGIIVLIRYLRRRNDAISDSELSAEEQQQVDALLRDATDKKPQ